LVCPLRNWGLETEAKAQEEIDDADADAADQNQVTAAENM
jgi:hypothetical protein